MMNKQGYESLDVVLTNSTQALDAATLSKKVQEGAVLLDIRNPSVFAQEHIKGAINTTKWAVCSLGWGNCTTRFNHCFSG